MRFTCLALAMLIVSGCSSLGRLDSHIQPPTAKESIFVFGVAPSDHQVFLFPGKVDNGAYVQSFWSSAKFFGSPQGGYIVGKADAGSTLGITRVNSGESLNARSFVPCEGRTTPVFKAEGGQILYYGDIEYRGENGSMHMRFGNDLERAREHLKQAYPALAEHLGQGSYEMLPVYGSCTELIFIPIHVGR